MAGPQEQTSAPWTQYADASASSAAPWTQYKEDAPAPAPADAPSPTPYPMTDLAFPTAPPTMATQVAIAPVYSTEHPTAQSVAEDIDRRIADRRDYLTVGGLRGSMHAMGAFLTNYGSAVKASEGQVFSHETLAGESFLSSPIKSLTEVAGQVPQFVASVAGTIAGVADTRLYDPQTGARIESQFDQALPKLTHGYIAGGEPTTELGREVNAAVGFLFSPAMALGPAAVQTQQQMTGSQSPYLHYVSEGLSDVAGLAAGAGLGRLGTEVGKRAPEAAAPPPEAAPPPAAPVPAPPEADVSGAREDMATALGNVRSAQAAYRDALRQSAARGSGKVQEAEAARTAAVAKASPEAVKRELEDEYRAMDVRTAGPRAADDPTLVRQRRKLVARDLADRQALRSQEASDAIRQHEKLARQHATRARKAGESFEAAVKAAPGDPLAGLPDHIRVPLERALTESQQRYLRALHASQAAPEDVQHQMEVRELSEADLSPEDKALLQGMRERAAARAAAQTPVPDAARMAASRQQGEAAADQLGLRHAITQVLGPELSKRVQFVKDEAGLPPEGRPSGTQTARGLRVSGLHTRAGGVYVVTDTVRTPEQAVWTAIHEVAGHGGMAGLVDRFGHLASDGEGLRPLFTKAREALLTNPTVKALADRIAAERGATDLPRMAEEAAAELQAARVSGRWDRLAQRYGIDVPEALRTGVDTALAGWKRVLHRIVNAIAEHVLRRRPTSPFERAMGGNAVFSDADVNQLLQQMHANADRGTPTPEPMESSIPGGTKFTTAKGSSYVIHEDGTTSRNKTYRPEHGEKEQGPQPRSHQTFYVSAEDAQKLGGEFQAHGGPRAAIVTDGKGYAGLRYLEGRDVNKIERRTVVRIHSEPALGLIPVELWKEGTRAHFGNEIVGVDRIDAQNAKTMAEPPSPFTPKEQAQLDAAMRSLGFSDRLNARLAGEQDAAKEAHAFDEAQQADARVEHAAAGAFGPEDEVTVAHVAEDGRGPAYTLAGHPFPVDEHGHVIFSDLDEDWSAEIPVRGRRPARDRFEGWFPIAQPGLTEAGVRSLQNLSDAEGTVQQGLAAMKRLWQGMQTMFPDITKPEIARGAAAMLERVSSARAEAARYSRNMRSFARLIAKLTPEQQAAVYRLAEQGTTKDAVRGLDVELPKNVDWKGWFKYIRHVHDRQFEAINRARGFDVIKYRQNHFARYVKGPDGTVFDSATASMTKEAFEHARHFPTMDSILNQPADQPRWKPYSLNLAMNEIRWAQSVQRYVAKWETTRTLARMGAIRTVADDYVPSPDETKFQAPDRQSWLAGPRTLVVAMHNGPFAEPLMGRAARLASAGMVLRPVWNTVTQSVLGLSLYHPVAITFFSAPVHALTESLALMRDPWSVQGVVDIARAFAKALPGAPGRSFVAGEHIPAHTALGLLSGKHEGLAIDKATGQVAFPDEDPAEVAMDVMRGLRPASDAAPAHVELMRRVAIGGMHVWGKGEFRNEAMEHFRDALDQHKALAAFGWSLPAFLRSLSTPIMDGFIPWMKLRAYLADTEGWSRANPGQVGSEAERLAFQRYAREIDQRFGEMATSNLFWNRWITGLLHGSMLSFGWNYGLVSQMLGGAKDVAQRGVRALQGRELPDMRTRLGYATLYTGYGLGLGFLMTHFMGKQPIQSLKDGVYPVMRTEPDGTAYRVKMPGWLQDFGSTYYHVQVEGLTSGVADVAANKTAPTLSLLHQLYTNENYFGQQIRDPMDPWYMQMAEAGRATMGEMVPFAVTNFEHQQGDPQGPDMLTNLVTNALGINAAASYTREPIPVQKIFYLQHSQGLSGVVPYANAVRDDGMRSHNLRQLFDTGRETGDYTAFMKAMREVAAKYGLTRRQARYEMERFAAPSGAFTLRELPHSDQEAIWDAMKDDPKLLRQYYPYFNRELRAQRLEADPALLQALRNLASQ